MTTAKQLLEISSVDQEIEHNTQSIDSIQAILDDDHMIVDTQQTVAKMRAELTTLKTEHIDLELTLASSKVKSQDVETTLYGGTVRNPRELEDLQTELGILRNLETKQEENLLIAMEAVDTSQSLLSNLESSLTDMQNSWISESQGLHQKMDGLKETGKLLKEKRDSLCSVVSVHHMQLYEKIKSNRSGQPMARLERGICQGCRLSLPTRVVQTTRTSQEPQQCPSCNRILYSN